MKRLDRIALLMGCLMMFVWFRPSQADPKDSSGANETAGSHLFTVLDVPADLRDRLHLDPFYQQYVDVHGFPVVGSSKVSKFAMLEATYLIDQMLGKHQEVLKAMADNKVRLTVMASTEYTTDIPEHSKLNPASYWDRRARGLGASIEVPCVSCAEENLLCLKGDPYAAENIMIHEFAHAVHLTGMRTLDETFDRRLKEAYRDARAKGLWEKTYAGTNPEEYFAEGVQSWFDTNRKNDAEHNDICTREKLKAYDPGLAKLVEEVYGDTPWRYSRVEQRKDPPHLKGFDRETFPAFKWREPEKRNRPRKGNHQRGVG